MSNQSYVEVNVALNGHHLFATAPRSADNVDKGKMLLAIVKKKFPSKEGYKVTAVHWETVGREVKS